MTPDAMRRHIDRYIAAYNRFDIDAMLATMLPTVTFENIAGGAVSVRIDGIDALRALAEQSAPLFSAREQTVLSFAAAGDVATVEIAFRAVVAADLPNGFKQGQVLEFGGRSEFRFADGAIAAITDIS